MNYFYNGIDSVFYDKRVLDNYLSLLKKGVDPGSIKFLMEVEKIPDKNLNKDKKKYSYRIVYKKNKQINNIKRIVVY